MTSQASLNCCEMGFNTRQDMWNLLGYIYIQIYLYIDSETSLTDHRSTNPLYRLIYLGPMQYHCSNVLPKPTTFPKWTILKSSPMVGRFRGLLYSKTSLTDHLHRSATTLYRSHYLGSKRSNKYYHCRDSLTP